MADEVLDLAVRVGNDAIAASRMLSSAIGLQARSLSQLAEGAEGVGKPELASGREARSMARALGEMMAAHAAQLGSRIRLGQKAIALGMSPEFGENCYCIKPAEQPAVANGQLALT